MNGHKSICLFRKGHLLIQIKLKFTVGSINDSRKNDPVSWLKVQSPGPSAHGFGFSKSRVDPNILNFYKYHMQEVLIHVVHTSYFETYCSRVSERKPVMAVSRRELFRVTWMWCLLGPYVLFRLRLEIGRLSNYCRGFSFVAPRLLAVAFKKDRYCKIRETW